MRARADATAATGQRTLAAGWRHFATKPYEQVRLREIAAEAHVSAQTLHTRFGSKEGLFTACYEWFGRQEVAERPPAPAGDAREAIALLFERYEEHGPAVLRMLAQEERIPAIRRMTDAGRAYHRRWAWITFAPLLDTLHGRARERRLAAIVVSTDLLVWRILRLDMQLSRRQAEEVMLEMIECSQPSPS